MVPGVEAMVVTPIAAHTLAVRPLVVPATYRIVIEPMAGWADDLLVSFDGQTGTTLAPGETVDVRRADHRVCLIRLGGDGFFGRMRQKLHWGDLSERRRCGEPGTRVRQSVRDTASYRMITELRVRDLATIADVTLQLGPGLNVLTGETGAGKSMLVDALSLLLGERAASGSVRPGAAKTDRRGRLRGRRQAARAADRGRSASTSRTAG